MATGLATWAVAVSVTLAAVIDIRTRRIPNLLSLGSAALGLLAMSLSGGWHGLSTSLLGWLVFGDGVSPSTWTGALVILLATSTTGLACLYV